MLTIKPKSGIHRGETVNKADALAHQKGAEEDSELATVRRLVLWMARNVIKSNNSLGLVTGAVKDQSGGSKGRFELAITNSSSISPDNRSSQVKEVIAV